MKKIMYIILAIVGIVVLYFGVSAIIFFSSAKDKKNIEISGYVYDDKTKEPLSGVLIEINNSTYKAKESDYTDYSSYLGKETLNLDTNSEGYFSIKLERSKLLEFTFSKEGYVSLIEYDYAKKKIQKKIYLKKE